MIRPLNPSDINTLQTQDAQKFYESHITEESLSGLDGDNFSYIEDGMVKALVGMQLQWSGRAIVWALLGDVKNWVSFHREVKNLMENYINKRGIIRLEMTTEIDFVQSERWAKMLGFKEESILKNYGPDGKDHKMMVRL
ncbi:acyl-CoA N-acyltransferase [Vibrio phage 1.182.O._10N.286.46.E1]|nr:acyl-CoA N-acyltransferase [Vibrio phage 1.182.O._10N.286.46.E1]